MSTMNKMPDLLTPAEAAQYLRVEPGTLQQWRWAGTGPTYVKVGRSVRYPLDQLADWLELNTRRPA